jgi:hypothetical protein
MKPFCWERGRLVRIEREARTKAWLAAQAVRTRTSALPATSSAVRVAAPASLPFSQ